MKTTEALATDPGRNEPHGKSAWTLPDLIGLVGRATVGGGFLYLGWAKVVDPVGFLKVIRQYEIIQVPVLLNTLALVIPWLEVCCGILLLAGVAVRGGALLSLALLIPFTALVLGRALTIYAAGQIPFCAIHFDCGCGGGEVMICWKLFENGILMLLSASLLGGRSDRWCLKHAVAAPA